ncbi:MAG: glycosyltransferase family 4 protein [Oscillospiraceae bacterium]
MSKILVISQHYWPENFRITDICEGFVQNGIEVDVLCGLPNYPKGEYFEGYSYTKPRREEKGGVNIYRCGEILRKGNTSLRIFLNYISYPITAVLNLLRLVGKKYDAVFCYETSPVLMMLPAIIYSKIARIPLTTYVLDLWPENLYSVLPIKNKVLRAIAKGVSHWFYRRSDRLIAMSPALKEKLLEIAPKREVTVIEQYCEDFYAVDVQDEALNRRFANKFNIVFAGNFSPAQDLGLLVTCAEKLKENNISDIHFVLLGDGMSKNELCAAISNKNLKDYFTFEGQQPVTRVPAYHTVADALFAALAKSENLGLTVPAKITSYMAAGRPLLVAIDGEAARVVKESCCGLVSAAGDAQALYENIIKLFIMPKEKRTMLGDCARKYYNDNYKREKLLAKLFEFIL